MYILTYGFGWGVIDRLYFKSKLNKKDTIEFLNNNAVRNGWSTKPLDIRWTKIKWED